MNITATLLTATFSLFLASVASAQLIIEEWTFNGPNPQIGINGMTQNNCTTAAPNSVPSAGVLRYATDGNGNSSPFASAIDTSTISSLTLTVDLTDMNLANQVSFQFGGTTGSKIMVAEFNNFNGEFSLDMMGGETDWSSSGTIFDQNTTADPTPFTVALTWDFANSLMSYSVSGTATKFDSSAADLSTLTSITNFRPRGGAMGTNGTYLDLNTVTIQTIPEPSSLMLLGLAFLAGIPMFRRLKR